MGMRPFHSRGEVDQAWMPDSQTGCHGGKHGKRVSRLASVAELEKFGLP